MYFNILWIEDDYIVLKPLIKPLEKAGYIFDYAKNQREALECLSNRAYDLIILDIIIPEGEYHSEREPLLHVGVKLLHKIVKELGIKTPIIVVSVLNDKLLKDEIKGLGVKKVLAKGRILPSELKKEVDKILKNK
jgi:CheY-like chemotaxis protein